MSSDRQGVRRVADWVVRLGLPLGVFAVVIAVFVTERAGIAHELQIIAPPAAVPSQRIAVRAHVFDLSREGGAELLSMPVRLRVFDGPQRVGETILAPSVAGGAEGSFVVADDAAGPLRLEAVATIDDEPVASVSRELPIGLVAPDAELTGRMALAMQHFEPGPVEPVGDAPPPHPLDVRIVGGACVPEAECELLVHVGEPAAAVRVVPSASVDAPRPSPSGETRGLVRLPLVVHGPEAHAELEASRGGEVVARRALRLPVALATPAVTIPKRIIPSGEPLRLRVDVLGDRPGVIVDAYQLGRWHATGSFAPTDETIDAPLDPLPDGLHRLQVRTDPFSAERAAVRMVLVGDDLQSALREIQALGGDQSAPEGPAALRFAWAAASLEMGLRVLPPAVSGHDADLARVRARQRTMRIAAVVAILLGLAVATVVLLRRGVESALEAQRVMDQTGDPELASARHRRRTLLSALAIVATVLLAFLGAAALIVARAHLLE